MAQRVIDGKRYDTATAEAVGEAYRTGYADDFTHVEETLYRTDKGRWFLSGTGGPMSRWAKSVGENSFTGGSGLCPLTRAEALEWLEARDRTADIQAHFADMIEAA